MNKYIIFSIIVIAFTGCTVSKWETIAGNGINDDPKSIDQVIYFESLNRGVIGGYSLVYNIKSKNIDRMDMEPTLYLTEDGGRNWKSIKFELKIKKAIENAYLNLDTLICQTDSLILLSINKGCSFKMITNSNEYKSLSSKYFSYNQWNIDNSIFEFKNKEYSIKEKYKNQQASVIVCYGSETMTDYYFVSFDHEKNWVFLQKDFGDNRQRFLYKDKYLYCYAFPFGLQKLKLR